MNNEFKQAVIIPIKQKHFQVSKAILDMIIYCHSVNKIKNNFISFPFNVIGKVGEVGTKYIIKVLQTNMLVFYEYIEIITTDYFTHLKVHAYKTIPKTFEYYHVIDIFDSGNDKSLICSWFVYDNDIHIYDYIVHQEMLYREVLYKHFNNYIAHNEYMKYFYTGVDININLDLIWKILLNMKMIHKYAKILCHEIKYENSLIDTGIEVDLIYKKKSIKGKIEKLTKFKNKGHIKIYKINENTEEFFPLKKINIIIYEYENKVTMYIFFIFITAQNLSKLTFLKGFFQKELQKFKKITEHYFLNMKEFNHLDK